MPVNNINPNIAEEAPKHEQVKDEKAIADVALTRGQSAGIVTDATGYEHCGIAAAGAMPFVVMEDVAAGALARLRYIGHAPVRTITLMPSGTLVMADGLGNWILHVAGANNFYGGKLGWPSSGEAGHLVQCWLERGED